MEAAVGFLISVLFASVAVGMLLPQEVEPKSTARVVVPHLCGGRVVEPILRSESRAPRNLKNPFLGGLKMREIIFMYMIVWKYIIHPLWNPQDLLS